MPTNYERASLELTGTFSVPISYSTLSLFDNITHKDQIEVYRSNIETIYETANSTTITLTRNEKTNFGIIKPEWITYDEVTKTITAISIPTSQPFTRDDSTIIYYPAMSVGESLVIRRRVVSSDVLVEWITGSRITAEQLNLLASQLIGIGQENKFDLEDKVVKLDDADIEYATPAYVDASFDNLADLITLPSGIENANDRDKCLVVLSRVSSTNTPQAAASLKWDASVSKLQLLGLASQTQNRLELLASDGVTLLNYFNSRGVLNNCGRVFYGTTTPTVNALDTGLLWWDTTGGNQVLKTWNGTSWDSLTVGAGTYVTTNTTQTITGAKTFSAATAFSNTITITNGSVVLAGTGDISGSGASKTIVLKPTTSGSVATTVLTASDTQVSIASGKILDYDTLSTTAKTITCTLADNQTIAGIKTINNHIVLGPSTTYSSQSTITTSDASSSASGSNLVFRINGSATTRYIKLNKETESTFGIELRPKNQAGSGSTYLQGPTIQNDGDFTLGASSRIRNIKNTRIPGSCMIFTRAAGNVAAGSLANTGGLPSIPEANITCSQTATNAVISVVLGNSGSTEQQYRITWEQYSPANITTGTNAYFITPVIADTITLAGGGTQTWTITTNHSATYLTTYHTKVYVTVIY